jgi:hypothetical protein
MSSTSSSPLLQVVVNGRSLAIDAVPPHTTLLDFLRDHGLTGAKEGCAEGECGTCAVALVVSRGHGSAYHAINSCLMFVPMAAGREFYTAGHGFVLDGPAFSKASGFGHVPFAATQAKARTVAFLRAEAARQRAWARLAPGAALSALTPSAQPRVSARRSQSTAQGCSSAWVATRRPCERARPVPR